MLHIPLLSENLRDEGGLPHFAVSTILFRKKQNHRYQPLDNVHECQ